QRAAVDGEYAPQALVVRQGADAADEGGSVAADDAADQRHVPRARQRAVGDAAAGSLGPVAGDDAVLDHQVGPAHPDAAPAPRIPQPMADGQALEGDPDRAGAGAEDVEDAVDALAVNDGGARPGALKQGAVVDVEVADGVVNPHLGGDLVDAGGQDDGIGAEVGIGPADGLAQGQLAVVRVYPIEGGVDH